MNNQLIYFTSVLALLMAVTVSVPAQENSPVLNATLNNTTMNNTTVELMPEGATLDVTLPENLSEENLTMEDGIFENATSETSSEEVAALTAPESVPQKTALIGEVFAIGSGLQSEKLFVVNGNARPKDTFMVGIPIKPCRDVGKMVFVCDIV